MRNITLNDLSQKTGLHLRNMGDLLKIKVVVDGPKSDVYGMTVVSFRMCPTVCNLTLHGQMGETLWLRRISEISWAWEFQTPEIDSHIEVTNINFYF
ncbi:MAG: hypothetical protein WCI57_01475 [Candidatus Berkelbacteria bacterium]